jgi:integrase
MSVAKRMVTLVQEYLDYRRKLGFQLRIEGQLLLRFAEYADQLGHQGPITTELALQWARLPEGTSRLYQARRLEVVRCFAKYRAIFDPETEVPPDRLLGKAHRRTQPHVYSDAEIQDLMAAAGRLPPTDGLRCRTYRTLFGPLASTGATSNFG